MSYCTYTDVAADFKDITFNSSSLVTDSDVTQFIVEADALIDSYVGMTYQVPVSGGTEALALLKLYSRTIVAERIRGMLEVKQQKSGDANQNVRSGLSVRDVLKFLTDIRSAITTLPGATALITSGGFYSDNYSNSRTPIFQKGTKQW